MDEDRVQYGELFSMIMNLLVPEKAGHFFQA
jgi:hypothetical protein